MNTNTEGKKNDSANPSKVVNTNEGNTDIKVSKPEISEEVQHQIDVLTEASITAKHKTGVMLQNYLAFPSSIPTLDTVGLVMSKVRGLDNTVITATLAIVKLHSKGVLFQLVDQLEGDKKIKPELLVNKLVNTVKKEMAIAPLLKYLGWTRTDLVLDFNEENQKLKLKIEKLEAELQKAKTLESRMK